MTQPIERERMLTQWGVATDTGGRRSVNEDAVLAQPPVFVVADGMGGHARGDMASRTVVAALRELAERAEPIGRSDVEDALDRAAQEIRATMAADTATPFAGPESVAGTTVAGAVRTERDGVAHWLVLNVGDSRVYRFAEGELRQVSVDHSLVQEMVDAGTLSPAAARTHPRRNVITRAVGTSDEVEVDFWLLPIEPGERLLLCTDGLIGELEDTEIAEVLANEPDPSRAAEELLRRAVTGGANDNVTVVVVDAVADDAPGGGAAA
ncbi:PP2C family protein-serine/threonine phosphatase [Georgenia thermotolerans]|uniref:SpoIIE family protein phosphatase n=1 Tax=Georgenia thermotolerans TaxID=527326 RepID=A0A7J5UQP8_9MICO|nr:protein phosphatase 2C domain-containing protein [Georgenia thermotolerans]KAE8764530.1 SpoIIE family protein phosphatase [Georgenia thermotolerans]